MSTTQQRPPKLPIVFICIWTLFAIVAPVIIVLPNQAKIKKWTEEIKKTFEEMKPTVPQLPTIPQTPIIPQAQTYKVSDFTAYGKAVNDGNWVGNIDKNSGFRFTAISENQTNAKLSLKYKSEKQGGVLKVNGKTENLYFLATNGNWQNKDVIVKLQQGENNIEFCSGWLTDFAPDISEIALLSDNTLEKNYMAGVWKGYYSNKKGQTTLTINDDMTGVSEFVNKGTRGSYSVRVKYSDNKYSVSGVDWIDKPQKGWWSFANFKGNTIDGKYTGTDFNLEKTGTVVLLSTSTAGNKPHSWRHTFNTPENDWYSISFNDNPWQQGNAPFGNGLFPQNTRWTTSQIYIRTKFNVSDVSLIGDAYFCVWHDDDVQIYLNGQPAFSREGSLSNYESFKFDKTLLKNGENIIAAKCVEHGGGQTIDIGVFATFDTPTQKQQQQQQQQQPPPPQKQQQPKIDYTAKVESAVSNAINAFDDGRFKDAFNYYTEAAGYPTDRSTSIKQAAAKKFKEKAERLIQLNGGCDAVSKQLLQYANSLYSSSEIQKLLNKCK